jgi:hypothetical protein
MSYAIIRVEKVKSFQSVRRTLLHSFREQETPNANPDLIKHNKNYFSQNFREALIRFQALLPEKKIRKDAVLLCEYILTASPEYFLDKSPQEIDSFFYNSAKFIAAKHGAKNIVLASIHFDESSPHMHMYVVPKTDDGRLSCKEFFGSPKALNKLQDDFYSHIAKTSPSLQRGIKNTKVQHTDVKDFAALINSEHRIELPASVKHESEQAFINKIRAQAAKITQLEFNKKAADLRAAAVTKLEERVAELEADNAAKALIESLTPRTEEERIRAMYSHSFVPADRFKKPESQTKQEYRPQSKDIDDGFEFTP